LGTVHAALSEGAHAQSEVLAGQPKTSLNEVEQAILAPTGFGPAAVALLAPSVEFVVTLVNSKLVTGPPARRESEASRITAAIAGVIAEMPKFKGIQAIHIVSRRLDGSRPAH